MMENVKQYPYKYSLKCFWFYSYSFNNYYKYFNFSYINKFKLNFIMHKNASLALAIILYPFSFT